MPYMPPWERLPDALMRVAKANGFTQNDAQADICRAIAHGAVRIRAKLGRHATKRTTSYDTVLEGKEFQIPTGLKAEDFDWQNSRPRKPWLVRHEAFNVPGYWNLEWIELCRADVTSVLCAAAVADVGAQIDPCHTGKIGKKSRSRPAFERAQRAIKAEYPDGVPQPAIEPNANLYKRIGKWLKKNNLSDVSDDTILRAAGRRK